MLCVYGTCVARFAELSMVLFRGRPFLSVAPPSSAPSIRSWLAWLPCRRRGSFLSIILLLFGLLGPRCCRFCSQHDSALVPYALDWVPCAVCRVCWRTAVPVRASSRFPWSFVVACFFFLNSIRAEAACSAVRVSLVEVVVRRCPGLGL